MKKTILPLGLASLAILAWTLALGRQGDKIVLSGMLPNESMRERFVQILQPMAGAGGYDQRITLTPESPEAWQNIVNEVSFGN
jgi:hypothetical protein